MAGSLNHIVGADGRFKMDTIGSRKDAHEALQECFDVILRLSGGRADDLNPVLRELGFPAIDSDMRRQKE